MRNRLLIKPLIILSIIAAIIYFPFDVIGQEYIYAIDWQQESDMGYSIMQSKVADTSYVIAGKTESFGESRALIAKYSFASPPIPPVVTLSWAKNIFSMDTDTLSNNSIAVCIKEDNNGDYIACGVANTPGNEKDILLAKLQPNGTPVFLYAYDVITRDNVVRMNDIARDMIIDSYGNYVIVGHTNSTDPTCDILIAKFDNAGGFLWAKTLGEPGVRDIGRAIIENSDGNYIILGYSGEFYSRDIVLAEFSPFGTLIKSVKIDGNGEDYGWDIVEDQTDSAYVVAGWKFDGNIGQNRLLIFKIHKSLGFWIWAKVTSLDVTTGRADAGISLIKQNSNYIVAGFTENGDTPDQNVLISAFDNMGSNLWTKIIPGANAGSHDEASCIIPAFNPYSGWTGYAMTGFSDSYSGTRDILLASLDVNSDSCYTKWQTMIDPIEPAITDFPNIDSVSVNYRELDIVDIYPEDSLVCYSGEEGHAPYVFVIIPPNPYGGVGGSATIPITYNTNSMAEGFSAVEFHMSYDHDNFTLVDIQPCEEWSLEYHDGDDLLLRVALASSHPVSGSGTLCNMKFDVSPNAQLGFYPIEFIFGMVDEDGFDSGFIGGGINVVDKFFGDVSGDGFIHAYDAALVLQHLIGYTYLNPEQLINADVSGDNYVSAYDASLILQYIVGLINSFPVMGDTTYSVPATGTVSMTDITANPGETIDISVNLNNGNDIYSIESLISFDPDYLQFLGYTVSEDLKNYMIVDSTYQDHFHLAAASSESDGHDGVIMTLKFKVLEIAENAMTNVTIDDLRWNEDEWQNNPASCKVNISQVGIDNSVSLPHEFTLHQNYPNPFNPTTTLTIELPKDIFMSLTVYDILGNEICKIVEKNMEAGYHQLVWNGINNSGYNVPSGIYIAKMESKDFTKSIKMILMR